TPYENPQGPGSDFSVYHVSRGDITIRGRQDGYVIYNGMKSPSPTWVRIQKNIGGVRCARSDQDATATGG
ncbi:MAG TPA: hypothetical protein PK156_51110, partial [Polyangium sp.]|nr:hypothetical protein [Polyangium sp.]